MTGLNRTEAKIVAIKVAMEQINDPDKRVEAKEVIEAAKEAVESVERNS